MASNGTCNKILCVEFCGDVGGGPVPGNAAEAPLSRGGAAAIRKLSGVLRVAASGTEFASDESAVEGV